MYLAPVEGSKFNCSISWQEAMQTRMPSLRRVDLIGSSDCLPDFLRILQFCKRQETINHCLYEYHGYSDNFIYPSRWCDSISVTFKIL